MPKPPKQPGHARIIAIANQKGGVGKSTTAVSLGAALADLGFRVLVVDLDPQGNASTGLGIRHDARATTVYDIVIQDAPVDEAVVETGIAGLRAIPSTIDLAGAEIELVSQFSRETRLKKALEPVRDGAYDFILLDCPPSLGLLTVNALTAAEELIVPIQCEYYALEGLGQLLRNVSLVQQNINPGLRLTGIVMTMFDARTKLSEQVVEEVRRFFGDLVYDVIIPRTVRLSEAPGFGQPITLYDPRSKGAQTYRDLAREVALRPAPETPMPSYEDLPVMTVTPFSEANDRSPHEVDLGPDDDEEARPSIEHHEPLAEAPAEVPAQPSFDEARAAADSRRRSGSTTPVHDQAAPAATTTRKPPPKAARSAAPPKAAPDDDVWEDDSSETAAEPHPVPAGPHPDRRVVVIDEDRDIDIRAGQERPVHQPEDEPAASDDGVTRAVAPIGGTLRDDEGGRRRRWRLFRKGGE